MDYPRVSILTPVYNGEKYLAECIESVLAQYYTTTAALIVPWKLLNPMQAKTKEFK